MTQGEEGAVVDNLARAARRARGQSLRDFAASLGLGPVTQAMREQGAAPMGPLSRALYRLITVCERGGHRAWVNAALAEARPREDRCFFRLLSEVLSRGDLELARRVLCEADEGEAPAGFSGSMEELRARMAPISRELESWSARVEDRAARQLETAAARVEEAIFYLGLAERSLRRASEQDLLSTTRLPSESWAGVSSSGLAPAADAVALLADLLLGAERAPFDETPELLAERARLDEAGFAREHPGPFILGLVTPSRGNPLLYTRGKHDALAEEAAGFLVEAREPGDELAIGRGEDCALHLPVAALAERHALLYKREQGWGLVDVGDGAGVTIAGRVILPGEEVALAEGEMLRLGGDVQVRILCGDRARSLLAYLERYENP